MIDLRNIAQQLRLPADQLRLATDLLEQGYQPAFIARYRADETGHLPSGVLWALKFAIEREHQLSQARQEALAHLGDGVELDEEGRERVERGQSTVAIDVALRCFRSRRAARQSGERSGQASQLLEKMIAASGPVADLPTWTAEQMGIEVAQSEGLIQQASRLVATLLSGDTRLMERMRQTIQKRATVKVEAQAEPTAKSVRADKEGGAGQSAPGQTATDPNSPQSASDASSGDDHDASDADAWAHADDDLVGDHAEHHDEVATDETHEPVAASETVAAGDTVATGETAATGEAVATESAGAETASSESPAVGDTVAAAGEPASETSTGEPPISLTFESSGKKSREGKLAGGKRKGGEKASAAAKAAAKLTPRQRRRRWLGSVLQPLKSLKRPINRLTAYQMLMIGRGQRSQLIKVDLDYDRRQLINMARDVFVPDAHPLAKWFVEACEQALSGGLFAKAETDALAEEDELAQQTLLEAATDQLRAALLQRPVKGHRILVVDTVGPNSACIAIIDARGKCLSTQEVVCSSLPSVVSQNVIMLGELVHKHKVTLVAISNGPARRFLIHTVAELMKQSASSNLRWTMVDRGGAEAYATSRHASVELPQLNRRFRAAVWLGRRLQDPLGELLKLDTTRLRLGSYQRELPQEPLKRLVSATLSDCLCVKGVDARYASEQQFSYVPGVTSEIATRLGEMASKREFTSREALLAAIADWPETGKRQALGFLRIYQSPQTLDGTLIHPDDYHLAQRLIENTELTQPPSAPEGWLPPKIKVPKPPRGSQNPGSAAAAFGEGLNESSSSADADAPAASADTADSTAPADSTSEATPAVDASALAGSEVSSDAATLTQASDQTSDQAGSDSPTTDTPVEASDETGAGEASVQVQEESHAVAIAPEYSEDVVVEQAAEPTFDAEKLARGWQVGRAKLAWLANCLANPFGDTRDKRPPVPMLTSVPTLADLQPGMSVYAIVVGVAEFGAFVELGPDCGGLIHISRLSSSYVEDPHQAVQIGDLVQAWVVSVDADKKRVALTALSPEQQRRQAEAQREQESARRQESRPQRGGGHGGGQGGGHGGQHSAQGHGGQGHAQAGQGQGQSGSRGGGGGGQDRGGGRPGGGGRPQGGGAGAGGGRRTDRGGAPAGGRSRSGGGGGGGGRRDGGESRPVIVKSKKPAAPITEAMKKGQEPLRSFSDLLQFYEVKRTDVPGSPAPPESASTTPTNPTATPTEVNAPSNESPSTE
ncbi:MAG: S1 RNA-binding domain-containing protein [Pirellulaceae bacterium]|nr:S1 RNA-binding domain-containing protein [Pirellulaceae bacterium]